MPPMVFSLRVGRCVYVVPVANVEVGWSRFEVSLNLRICNCYEGREGRDHCKTMNYITFPIGPRMCSLFINFVPFPSCINL